MSMSGYCHNINVRYTRYHFIASISCSILSVSAVAMVLPVNSGKQNKNVPEPTEELNVPLYA